MKNWQPLGVLLIGVAIAVMAAHLPFAQSLNLHGYDFLLANTKTSAGTDDIVVIAIDDESLKRFDDPLVLWHKYLAKIISGVADGGAIGIGMDIIPTISLDRLAPELDRELISSIRHAGGRGSPVLLGFKAGRSGLMPHNRKFLFASEGLGFLNLYPDKDGRIRTQRLSIRSGKNRKADSFSLLLAGLRKDLDFEALENSDNKELPPSELYIDYRLPLPLALSLSEVYDWAEKGNTAKLGNTFKDKIVLIGVTSRKLPDIYKVPIKTGLRGLDSIPGVFIQSLTAQTLLAGQLPRDAPLWLVIAFSIVIGLISGSAFLTLSPLRGGAVIALLCLAVACGMYMAFSSFRIVVPLAPLAYSVFIPGSITRTYRYLTEYRQFRHLQRFFKSYVHPKVMQEIIDNPGGVSMEGEKVVASVMFTDIRNYSTLSEHMDPRALVHGLNTYYKEMTEAITGVQGYLNQYLGDGILAVFGAPNKLADDGALAAVRCGINMQERLEQLNKQKIFPGISGKIRIGIGIHTGEAVVGNIGCYEKMTYSIIGDTPNLASRIEGMTKQYKVPLLVSESTYERVKDRVEARFVAKTLVKGREQEVKLYEIISIKEGN